MITIIDEQFRTDKDFYLEKLKGITRELGIAGDIVIKLGDKEEGRELNKKYRKKDYPTDVLSFPFNEELPEGYYLGDIFIRFPVAKEQAQERQITIKEELLTLMIHGILHLSGYDHERDTGKMNELQEQLVEKHYSRPGE